LVQQVLYRSADKSDLNWAQKRRIVLIVVALNARKKSINLPGLSLDLWQAIAVSLGRQIRLKLGAETAYYEHSCRSERLKKFDKNFTRFA
jgi:hypothetical protein